MPGETAVITAELLTGKISEKKHSLLMEGFWRPVETLTGLVLIDFGAGFTQTIELEATVVRPRLHAHFPEDSLAPSLIDRGLIPGLDKSLPTLNFGFIHLTSFYPGRLTFQLSNETDAPAAWQISAVVRPAAQAETQVRLFREREGAHAIDSGFEVFSFSEISGKLRGPTRALRRLPAPTPLPSTHSDAADFEPVSITVSFKPKIAGFHRSVFKLQYSGERNMLFACEGCGSLEESDELRIAPGLFAALRRN